MKFPVFFFLLGISTAFIRNTVKQQVFKKTYLVNIENNQDDKNGTIKRYYPISRPHYEKKVMRDDVPIVRKYNIFKPKTHYEQFIQHSSPKNETEEDDDDAIADFLEKLFNEDNNENDKNDAVDDLEKQEQQQTNKIGSQRT
jgi:hypothetical protein